MRSREFFARERTRRRAQGRWGLNKKGATMLLSIAGTSFAGVVVCSALLYLLV